MRRLIILAFMFVAFYDVNCETYQTTNKPIKGNVETSTYHPHQFYISNPAAAQHHQVKDLFYYNKDPLTANQGQASSLSSKHTPSTVLYREDSGRGPVLNYPTSNYQFQTIFPQRPVPDYFQSLTNQPHVPLSTNKNGFLILSPANQHAGYYQPTNQYSVAQPYVESSIRQPQVNTGPVQFYNAPAYSQFHLPIQTLQPKFNELPTINYQNLLSHSNQQISQQSNPAPKIQPAETPKQTLPVSSDFQLKSPPLFQHQVHHPLQSTVKHLQPKIINRPYKAGPPTPPRIYKVFTPMMPRQVIPVTEQPVPQKQLEQQTHDREVDEEEENEDKAEVNEEEEDENDERENEKIEEDDDHSDVKDEEQDEEDDFRPGFGFAGKHRHNDDEDDDDRHYSHYRHHDDVDHDSADSKQYSKNIKPKQSSKYKYPKNYAANIDYTPHFKQFYPSFYEHKTSPGPDFKQPKVEVKMYKYTRASNEPQKMERIEGKGSELKPVIQHNQKMYQSKWIISTKTSSSTE